VRIQLDSQELAEGIDLKEATRELSNEWFSKSQERLLDEGDDHEYEVYPVVQSGQPPRWTGENWEFSYPHVAAAYFEYGTEPHEIEAKNAEFLAFEWPDAPDWVREQFRQTFPTVFFKSVDHPGTPALRYLRGTRDEL